MAPESHFNNPFFPNDRSLAAQIVEASKAEHTHVASSEPKKPSKKKMDSDAASVSSFGSSIGLLKNKFHHSSSSSSSSSADKKKTHAASVQKKVLRNQVNIVG
ncbi:hypothetical protein CONLIGDRAFT_678563 [Coniochaeta ligniaria NRRL 30616]|uniref:Uncharacterized protein n=1 Tax=Coniochaeta ligniaria NRRL 30616 TaxID=1408157 RepID=A0A1J7JS04_9PEZI|nr:hypothetical protein CONLIGDRAFT_678563 [Coniochaeta ligniaria NRRL 30616]